MMDTLVYRAWLAVEEVRQHPDFSEHFTQSQGAPFRKMSNTFNDYFDKRRADAKKEGTQ